MMRFIFMLLVKFLVSISNTFQSCAFEKPYGGKKKLEFCYFAKKSKS